jgi:putative SOS response-associated peptidase YedK
MGELYDRMPCILGEGDCPLWLGEEEATNEQLLDVLRPCPDEWLKIWPVDRKVCNVRNKGEELILPLNLQ